MIKNNLLKKIVAKGVWRYDYVKSDKRNDNKK